MTSPSTPVVSDAQDALAYLTPHERTADGASVMFTAGKLRAAIAAMQAELATLREAMRHPLLRIEPDGSFVQVECATCAAMQAEHCGEVERLQGLITTLMSQRAELRVSLAGMQAEHQRTVERLRKAKEIVDLWFAPWGAAKGAKWEDTTGDREFSPDIALALIRDAIAGEAQK